MNYSVVIPAFNAEKFIFRSINSALRQSLKPLEIIVIDDGSNDKTYELVNKLNGIVRCIRQSNKGCSHARNRGIQEAKGDFIVFLDADDEWFPNHIKNASLVLEKYDFLHWYCAAIERRDESGGKLYKEVYKGHIKENSYIENFFRAQAECKFANTQTMVIKKSVFEECGNFDETMRHGEDKNMWFRIALKYPQIGYCNEIQCIYWAHGGAITQQLQIKTAKTYYSKFKKMRASAIKLGEAALKESEPLLLRYAKDIIFKSLKEKDVEVQNDIYKIYGSQLSLFYKSLIIFGRFIPDYLIQIILKLKSTFKPY